MTSNLPWLLTLGPLLLAAVALAPRGITTPRRLAAFGFAAALVTVALAAGAGVSVAVWGALATPTIGLAGGGLGLRVDALSATMFTLVAFVGAAVIGYSRNYLDGDPNHASFLKRLCLTVACVLMLVVSGNLVQLIVAWIATSVGLNALLTFYAERRPAQLAARKKFVISRMGDACLIAASILLWSTFGAFDFQTIFAGAKAIAAGSGATGAIQAAALLIAAAALLKSAQFPLHGWILEVMETPTPVSALLHAGIINAGGFLVLRLSDVMVMSTAALDMLAVFGGVTALFGSLAMLSQTSVKVGLAYSTIAQMGFMLLQCGLGAFSAALLHIVAHSLYKAHAFLSSGGVIDLLRASWSPSPGGQPHPARMAIAVTIVLGLALAFSWLFGATPVEKPGVFALGAVMLMGLTILLANAIDERPNGYVVGRAVLTAGVVACLYFALQRGAEYLLHDALPPTLALRGPFDLAIVVCVVAAFALIAVLQGEFARQAARPFWQAAYVHMWNGLYVNTLANRMALKLWPATRSGKQGSV